MGRPSLRLSLNLYHVCFLGTPEQRGEVDCRGWWWSNSPQCKTTLHPLSWKRWRIWSVRGARGAGSTCPVRWPSSESVCRGCRTRGRVDGCDLQREQLTQAHSHISGKTRNKFKPLITEQMNHDWIKQNGKPWRRLCINIISQWLTQMRNTNVYTSFGSEL